MVLPGQPIYVLLELSEGNGVWTVVWLHKDRLGSVTGGFRGIFSLGRFSNRSSLGIFILGCEKRTLESYSVQRAGVSVHLFGPS